jgi:hypothetical protein
VINQYFIKYDFSRSFKKKTPVSKKNLKAPEVAPMFYLNYQLKIPARI